jgi:multicomponent Na+:H+ antiporter subunit E
MTRPAGQEAAGVLRAFALRAILLAAVYWAFAEGVPGQPFFGAAAVLAAAAASVALLPRRSFHWSLSGLARFLPYFLWQSARGGADVAGRALAPSLPLATGCIDYGTSLSTTAARVFFANIISLLPGTLSVRLRDDRLRVHTLDTRAPVASRLRELEERVARLFDEPRAERSGPA